MNEEINKIIDSLEGCIGMFDYMITPIESNLLVSYIRELQQKYLNAVADYETTMSELQELKKQLEEYKRLGFKHLNDKCNKLENQRKEFIDYLGNEIYSIEPKGTGINYNCEYDSEEDYISAMKEQSKLDTFKEILSKYRSII